MKIATPSLLSEIDAVEVVDLRVVDFKLIDRVTDYMPNARAAPCWRVAGEDAAEIAALWRNLPEGEQMRCHVPTFGFRFYAGSDLISEASVCWKCNNIHGVERDRELFFAFDSSHPISQHLLKAAQRISGIAVAR